MAAAAKLGNPTEECHAALNERRCRRGIVQHTTDILFREVWLHSDLFAARDRSLITLIVFGPFAQ